MENDEEMKLKLPEVPLFPGEKILHSKLKGVTYTCPVLGSVYGKLIITSYKLYFVGSSSARKMSKFFIQVPLCTISHAEKVGGTSSVLNTDAKNPYGIDVFCKDLRSIRFTMKQEKETKQRKILLEKLQEMCFPASNKLPFFANLYQEHLVGGWDIYKPKEEFSRQGLPFDSWRITNINEEYEFCETYPKSLVVPSSVTDDELRQVAQFRSRKRIPVLSWIHPNKQVTITRCSQPLTGINKRNRDDEKYIKSIIETNPHSKRLLIIDARPQANAVANMARGGGYERSEYTTSDLVFCDIQNIHVMRDSLTKLQDACQQLINDDKHWFTSLDQSQWFQHGKCILSAAIRIVDSVENKKISVLVHCSDGWDRTAQLTGLAMIMLDSYYRTLEGFEAIWQTQIYKAYDRMEVKYSYLSSCLKAIPFHPEILVLIEKEWLSFGHKFAQRIGHGDKNHSDSERSPVFLQFIDCVWQITQQFPTAFEFNEHFLILILDHLYSCLFGNFLCNCERERNQLDIKGNCKSLWSFVAVNRDEYLNPLYATTFQSHVILPIAAIRHLSFWSAYFLRYNPKHKPQDTLLRHEREILLLRNSLQKRLEDLERQVARKQNAGDNKPKPLPRIKVAQV